MSSLAVSLIGFAFIFSGGWLGMFLGTTLPQYYLSKDVKGIVKLGVGLVATTCALVLGLLISSAKNYYDTQSAELTEMSAKIVLLDRLLANYGPEANDARAAARGTVVDVSNQLWRHDSSPGARLDPTATGSEALPGRIQELSPKDDRQRLIQSEALRLETALRQTRWLMFDQGAATVPRRLVVTMILWLTIILVCWGIFFPRNAKVMGTLFVSALSFSGAIFLILEMYTPYSELIQISSAPLQAALAHMGQ